MHLRSLCLVSACVLLPLAGCTSQQLYSSGQGWQRNQCDRLADSEERRRCLASADTSYDQYKRDAGTAVK